MKGPVPTMAFRNIGRGNYRKEFSPGDVHSPTWGGLPTGYLGYWLQGNTPTSPNPTESFTCLHTPMILAAGSMQRAMNWLAEQDK